MLASYYKASSYSRLDFHQNADKGSHWFCPMRLKIALRITKKKKKFNLRRYGGKLSFLGWSDFSAEITRDRRYRGRGSPGSRNL